MRGHLLLRHSNDSEKRCTNTIRLNDIDLINN